MKSKLAIVLLFQFISTVISIKLNPEFAVKYFAEKNVRHIVVFACWPETDVFQFIKDIMDKNTRMSYNHINDYADISNILKTGHYKLGIVLDMDCAKSDVIFNQFSAANLPFDESYVWLTVTKRSAVPIMKLRELPLRLDSELAVALTNQNDTCVLYDVYNPSYRHGGNLNVTIMGFWNEENKWKNYLTQYKYKRRQNLHEMMLNFSTTLINKPEPDLETYLTSRENSHLDSMSRYHYALVLYLRDIYNFRINLNVGTSWGYRLPNGSYDGIVGDMLKGIVDASACHFQQRADRLHLIEYTVPTYGMKPLMFFRHPKKNTLSNQFLKPLEKNVWWLGLAFSIVCWIFLLIAVKVDYYYQSNDELTHADPPSDTSVIVVAAISQQGSSIEPNSFSGRIAFLTLFVWSLMMFQFYSASIVGSLLAPPKRFINTVWDLADSDLEVGYEDIKYMRFHLATKDDPASLYFHKKKFHNNVQKRKHWYDLDSGMMEVRKGGYGFAGETGSAYKIIEDTFTQEQICDIAEVALNYPQYVSLITSKNSPFKKMFIYGLRQMVQHGLVDHLIKEWTHRRPQCPESFQSQPLPIGLTEFSPAIFLILIGLIIASVLMVIENFRVILLRRKISQEEDDVNIQCESTTSSAISQLEA